jgi:hypothetical protein
MAKQFIRVSLTKTAHSALRMLSLARTPWLVRAKDLLAARKSWLVTLRPADFPKYLSWLNHQRQLLTTISLAFQPITSAVVLAVVLAAVAVALLLAVAAEAVAVVAAVDVEAASVVESLVAVFVAFFLWSVWSA